MLCRADKAQTESSMIFKFYFMLNQKLSLSFLLSLACLDLFCFGRSQLAVAIFTIVLSSWEYNLGSLESCFDVCKFQTLEMEKKSILFWIHRLRVKKKRGLVGLVQPPQRKINPIFLLSSLISFSLESSSSSSICSTKDMPQICQISPKASSPDSLIMGSRITSDARGITFEVPSNQYPSPFSNYSGRKSQLVTAVLPLR